MTGGRRPDERARRAETVKDETARSWLSDRAIDDRGLGSDFAAALRNHLDELDPDALDLVRGDIGTIARS